MIFKFILVFVLLINHLVISTLYLKNVNISNFVELYDNFTCITKTCTRTNEKLSCIAENYEEPACLLGCNTSHVILCFIFNNNNPINIPHDPINFSDFHGEWYWRGGKLTCQWRS